MLLVRCNDGLSDDTRNLLSEILSGTTHSLGSIVDVGGIVPNSLANMVRQSHQTSRLCEHLINDLFFDLLGHVDLDGDLLETLHLFQVTAQVVNPALDATDSDRVKKTGLKMLSDIWRLERDSECLEIVFNPELTSELHDSEAVAREDAGWRCVNMATSDI